MENDFLSIFYNKLKSIFTSNSEPLNIESNAEKINDEKLKKSVEKFISQEKGFDRIKELFKIDEHGHKHEYLNENLQILASVSVSGFILGSILEINESSEKFRRNNQITIYTDKKAATRAFVDYVYLQTIKGGTKVALKFGSFSGILLGCSMLIQAYRNKTTPLDYSIGGAISGGIFRLHHGLVNFMIGAAAGGLFGSIFGLVRYVQMKIMNDTYEERRYRIIKNLIIQNESLMEFSSDNKNKIDN